MLPKSLHTVSSLVAVARYVAASQGAKPGAEHVALAARILGYADAPDVHGLRDVAARKLARG